MDECELKIQEEEVMNAYAGWGCEARALRGAVCASRPRIDTSIHRLAASRTMLGISTLGEASLKALTVPGSVLRVIACGSAPEASSQLSRRETPACAANLSLSY